MIETIEPPRHFLAWVPRARPDGAIRQVTERKAPERARRPIGHVTGQAHLAGRVRRGDVIWLAGSHPQFGLPAPSLDGRIAVASKRKIAQGHSFSAGDGSAWLPWADAKELFRALRLINADGSRARLDMKRPLGPQLRTSRQIAPEAAQRFDREAKALLARPGLFISYRWRLPRATVGAIVAAAAAAGFGPWWDRWSAPRRLASGADKKERGEISGPELEALMAQGIGASAAALIVLSKDYGLAGATHFERVTIEGSGKPVLAVDPKRLRDPGGLRNLGRELRAFYQEVTGRAP